MKHLSILLLLATLTGVLLLQNHPEARIRQVDEEGVDVILGISWTPIETEEGVTWTPADLIPEVSWNLPSISGIIPAQIAIPTGDCAVSSKYPKRVYRWCAIITTEAKKHNLDPNFIAAVMLQESGGNPSAISSSGAVGLMQVMPSDGLASRLYPGTFRDRPTVARLKDPAFNVKYGTRMLAGLIKKHGSEREALRAYGGYGYPYSVYADKVIAHWRNYR